MSLKTFAKVLPFCLSENTHPQLFHIAKVWDYDPCHTKMM